MNLRNRKRKEIEQKKAKKNKTSRDRIKKTNEIKRQMAIVNSPEARSLAADLYGLAIRPVSQSSSLALELEMNAQEVDERERARTAQQDFKNEDDEVEVRSAKKRKINPVLDEKAALNLHSSLFKNIPMPLLTEVVSYIDQNLKTQSVLARTCKGFSQFFQPVLTNTRNAKLQRELNQHVVYAEKEVLELKLNILSKIKPQLLKEVLTGQAEVMDYSGRTVEGTPYRLALATEDVSRKEFPGEGMVEMIEFYLKLVFKGEAKAEISKQKIQQFPEGWEEQEEAEFRKDMEEYRKVTDAIGDAKENVHNLDKTNFASIKMQCATALNNFRAHLDSKLIDPKTKKNVVIRTGRHFNERFLLWVLTMYGENYDRFSQERYDTGGNRGVRSDRWYAPKNVLHWREVVGCVQRFLTTCLAQAYCQTLEDILSEPLSRSLKFRYENPNGCSLYPLPASGSGLGSSYALGPARNCYSMSGRSHRDYRVQDTYATEDKVRECKKYLDQKQEVLQKMLPPRKCERSSPSTGLSPMGMCVIL